VLAIFIVGIPLYLFEPSRAVLGDFSVYFEAAQRVRNLENLYDHSYSIRVADGRIFTLFYFYPPFLAHWLSFWGNLSFENAKLLWVSLSFASLIASSWCLSDIFQRLRPGALKSETSLCLFLSLVLCFEPTYWGIKEGQVNAIILALITGHICLFLRHKDGPAGAVLAIAALLKMSPFLLILLPLRLGRWRVIRSFAATGLLAALFLLATTPLSVYQDFLIPFGPLLSGTLERHYFFNFAFDKAVLQLFSADQSTALRFTIKLLLGTLPLVVAALPLTKGKEAQDTLIRYGMLTTSMILLAPTLWGHHLVWALVPLCILAGRSFPTKDLQLRHLTFTLGLFVLFSQVLLIQLQSCRAVFPGQCNPNQRGSEIVSFVGAGAPEILLHLTSALPGALLLALIALLWKWRKEEGKSSP
jgi:hypothetical protein